MKQKKQNQQRRQNLKESQEDLVKKIKANSKDAHFADKLLAEFTSVSIQLGINPTCVYIEQDEDALEINTGAYTLTKTSGVIVFSINGFKSILYPNLACYQIVSYLFEIKDIIDNKRYDEAGLTEQEVEEMYSALTTKIPLMLQSPTITMTNPILANATLDLITYYLSAVMEKAKDNKGNAASDEEAIIDMKETNKMVNGLRDAMKGELENEMLTN